MLQVASMENCLRIQPASLLYEWANATLIRVDGLHQVTVTMSGLVLKYIHLMFKAIYHTVCIKSVRVVAEGIVICFQAQTCSNLQTHKDILSQKDVTHSQRRKISFLAVGCADTR
ncbi:hypothetical protein KIN20_034560 [Parelaphostrongylus tenuis]|uniref:Uncharacterized protein n=1 Tax=Parelaphostrongylus tenuis TaxID=148309 RepID=A0AAD5RAK1_PARTN|nr:hypothetical protein KIN20_034560 [Parelaphostrongylus tenuis]